MNTTTVSYKETSYGVCYTGNTVDFQVHDRGAKVYLLEMTKGVSSKGEQQVINKTTFYSYAAACACAVEQIKKGN